MPKSLKPTTTCALIVAAGSSRRLGFDKLTVPLLGKPLILHTLSHFIACRAIDHIVLVTAKSRLKEFAKLTLSISTQKPLTLVAGGEERADSVWNGLEALPNSTDLVVVHDAARPLATASLIQRCTVAAQDHGAAACAEPVTDTLQRVDGNPGVCETVSRENLWRIQTPQAFKVKLLKACYLRIQSDKKQVTDETSAVAYCGQKIFIVENRDNNLKVTFQKDIPLVEWILQNRS